MGGQRRRTGTPAGTRPGPRVTHPPERSPVVRFARPGTGRDVATPYSVSASHQRVSQTKTPRRLVSPGPSRPAATSTAPLRARRRGQISRVSICSVGTTSTSRARLRGRDIGGVAGERGGGGPDGPDVPRGSAIPSSPVTTRGPVSRGTRSPGHTPVYPTIPLLIRDPRTGGFEGIPCGSGGSHVRRESGRGGGQMGGLG